MNRPYAQHPPPTVTGPPLNARHAPCSLSRRSDPAANTPGIQTIAVTSTRANIVVTKPTDGTWAAFQLAVCEKDDAGSCLALDSVCPAAAEGTSTCTVTNNDGLQQGVTYTVTASACEQPDCAEETTKSQQSGGNVEFTVLYE